MIAQYNTSTRVNTPFKGHGIYRKSCSEMILRKMPTGNMHAVIPWVWTLVTSANEMNQIANGAKPNLFPHIFLWGSCFWFCIPLPVPTALRTLFHTPSLSHTTLSHTTLSHNSVTHHLSNTQLCHTPSFTHTHLCHTPSFTHLLSHTIFFTHHLSNTHNFVTHHLSHTHTFVTHHLSHTTLSHNLSHTIFQTHNFVTHHLSLCHTPSFTHTPLSHTIFHTPSFTHHLFHAQLFHTTSLLHTTLSHTHNTTQHKTHTCSETSYRITDVECIVRAKKHSSKPDRRWWMTRREKQCRRILPLKL